MSGSGWVSVHGARCVVVLWEWVWVVWEWIWVLWESTWVLWG